MEIKSHGASQEIRVAFSLKHVELTNTLVAYRLGRGPLPSDEVLMPQLTPHLGTMVVEGITTKQSIADYLAGRSSGLESVDARLVVPGLRDAIRREGFMAGMLSLSKGADGVTKELVVNMPFEAFTKKGACLQDLLRIDYSAHMLFSLDGEVLPVGVHCNYIDARMVDGAYDLVKAVQILQMDPRVRFLGTDKEPGGHSADGIIHHVPGYNASEGVTQFLDFVFMPTSDDAKRLWAKQIELRSRPEEHPRQQLHRAMFDLDILGLRAGGAARHDAFGELSQYQMEA